MTAQTCMHACGSLWVPQYCFPQDPGKIPAAQPISSECMHAWLCARCHAVSLTRPPGPCATAGRMMPLAPALARPSKSVKVVWSCMTPCSLRSSWSSSDWPDAHASLLDAAAGSAAPVASACRLCTSHVKARPACSGGTAGRQAATWDPSAHKLSYTNAHPHTTKRLQCRPTYAAYGAACSAPEGACMPTCHGALNICSWHHGSHRSATRSRPCPAKPSHVEPCSSRPSAGPDCQRT